ncbi:hypothetical protein RHMOL_Rhmol05G0042800 [Rhododendron molle]|uniref:Uncharacterized protein n=1 Tax=Rhododendron molle TaxID=49168 RepID=A0ACC0NMR0_RHOML|nr:hypothetical protein RHMOL_Rhmol05G0042800 [Rhododendron molle]
MLISQRLYHSLSLSFAESHLSLVSLPLSIHFLSAPPPHHHTTAPPHRLSSPSEAPPPGLHMSFNPESTAIDSLKP